jgi:CBS domain-containing protein/ribosome-associated translation inhibitor RaiA
MSLEVLYEHFVGLMETKVDSLISDAVLVEPTDTVSHVISKISKHDAFDAFSKEKDVIMNVNTRDLLLGKDITNMKIRPFMHPIPGLRETDNVRKAVDILTQNRVRAAPVVRNDDVIGAVQARDILKLVLQLDNKWIKANQILTPNPIVIQSDTPLSTARKIMASKRLDHLPVLKNGKIAQVLTSYHLLHTILPPERVGKADIGSKKIRQLGSVVGNLGTNRMASCSPTDDLSEVVSSMLHSNTTFCIVTLWDRLQGIITYRDILHLLGTKMKSKVPLFILGMPKEDNAGIITEKFSKVLERLQKVYPDIQETKVYVKKNHGTGSRYNYDVSATIITPHKRYDFSGTGFDLSKVFDEMSGKLLRILSKRAKKRYKVSVRKMM